MNKLLILIIICILIGTALFFIFRQPSPKTNSVQNQQSSPESKTYTNSQYNYSFMYPGNYTLNSEYPNYLLLKKPSSPQYDWTFKVDTYKNTDGSTFLEFITKQLLLNCAADGPNSSLSCDKVTSQETFTSNSGISGYKIYLNQITTSNGKTATAEIGPYYVFDISSQTQNQAQAVNFYPASFTDLTTSDPTDAKTLENMAKSLKFN